jgi:hypothetical protein
VRNLSQVLARTPNGEAVAALGERLGLLTTGITKGTKQRREFVGDISQLAPARLSAEQSYWAGEFGRVVELVGLLQGQEKYLALKSKAAKSTARSRIRRDAESLGNKMTATALSDEAEDDPAVRDVEEQMALISVLLSSAMAAKEATTMYLSSISREISFRCAQIEARIY